MQKTETSILAKSTSSSGESAAQHNPKDRLYNATTIAAHKEAQDIMSGKKKIKSYSSAEEFLEDLKA